MKIPEAAATYLPKPSTARLKIPPHITEVHNPHNTRNMALIGTLAEPNAKPSVVDSNTGIDTVIVVGRKIAKRTNTIPKNDATINMVLLETLPVSYTHLRAHE